MTLKQDGYKKIESLLFSLIVFLLASCQQETILDEGAQTRSVSNNAFTFRDDCYIVWNDDSYMVDYAIVGSSEVPLDKPIEIKCRIYYTNGSNEDLVFDRIPAGSTDFCSENSSLGESLARPGCVISNVVYTGYNYSGTMDIVGLDNMDTYPWDREGGGGSGNTPQPSQPLPLSAEWTRGSYALGGELKELNYFNCEGGMETSYTMISKGNFVMEVVLSNDESTAQTFVYRDFAIQHKDGDATPYSKATYMYLQNSTNSPSVTSVTIPAGGSKTVYFYTGDLFYEGNDNFDYTTTPPYHIQLAYKNTAICGDDINVDYDEYNEGWW